jgi:hypothetical protein
LKLDNDRPDWQNISAESIELKYYWSRFDPLEIENDILYHKFENDVGDEITWHVKLFSNNYMMSLLLDI